mgnify:FL=1
MAHYFTNDDIKSDEKIITVNIKNQKYKFYVDNGVFSKKNLDYGTRTLLESLDLNVISGDVLDFGCGYGPIGIYVAKNTDSYVDMVDINKRSLNLACKNAILNKVEVNVFESDIYSNVSKKYDFIISNPPIRVGKEILYRILFEAYDYLKDGGILYIVINKNQGAKSVLKDLSKKYVTEVICKNKGFYVIKAKKR